MRSSMMTRSDAARATTGSAGMLAVRSTSTWPPALLLLLEGGSSAGAGAPTGRTANDGSDAALWNADGASLGAAPCAPASLTGCHVLPGHGVQGGRCGTCRVRLLASCGPALATRTRRILPVLANGHRVWREHESPGDAGSAPAALT